jgi:hypothetical protein
MPAPSSRATGQHRSCLWKLPSQQGLPRALQPQRRRRSHHLARPDPPPLLCGTCLWRLACRSRTQPAAATTPSELCMAAVERDVGCMWGEPRTSENIPRPPLRSVSGKAVTQTVASYGGEHSPVVNYNTQCKKASSTSMPVPVAPNGFMFAMMLGLGLELRANNCPAELN